MGGQKKYHVLIEAMDLDYYCNTPTIHHPHRSPPAPYVQRSTSADINTKEADYNVQAAERLPGDGLGQRHPLKMQPRVLSILVVAIIG